MQEQTSGEQRGNTAAEDAGPQGPAGEHPAIATTADVDFLIDLRQKLAEGYKDRCAQADTIAGGVLTACVSVAALIVAANATLALTNRTVAIIALVVLGLSGLAAAWARSGAGLRPLAPLAPPDPRGLWRFIQWRSTKHGDTLGKGSLLSHESDGFRTALLDLRAKSATLPSGLHADALVLWAARERALHRIARAKEQAAGAAGVLLVIGILLTAVLSIILVLDQPSKTTTKHAAATSGALAAAPRHSSVS